MPENLSELENILAEFDKEGNLVKARYYDLERNVAVDGFSYRGNNLHGFQKIYLINRSYVLKILHGRFKKAYIKNNGQLIELELCETLNEIVHLVDFEIRKTLK